MVATGVAVSASWVIGVAVLSVAVGLALKTVFFHRWLIVGILIDAGILSAAVRHWPFSLA